jgi:aryl-alcohol dehydrogenase-like predicted oxidoreductase
MNFLVDGLTNDAKNTAVTRLEAVADDLDCTVGQLAIAWAAHNPRVSTVITGASKIEQLKDNLGAFDVISRLSPDVMAQIDKITHSLAD